MILEQILSVDQTFFFSPVREAFVGLVPPPTPHAPREAPLSLSTSQAPVHVSLPPYRFWESGKLEPFPTKKWGFDGTAERIDTLATARDRPRSPFTRGIPPTSTMCREVCCWDYPDVCEPFTAHIQSHQTSKNKEWLPSRVVGFWSAVCSCNRKSAVGR